MSTPTSISLSNTWFTIPKCSSVQSIFKLHLSPKQTKAFVTGTMQIDDFKDIYEFQFKRMELIMNVISKFEGLFQGVSKADFDDTKLNTTLDRLFSYTALTVDLNAMASQDLISRELRQRFLSLIGTTTAEDVYDQNSNTISVTDEWVKGILFPGEGEIHSAYQNYYRDGLFDVVDYHSYLMQFNTYRKYLVGLPASLNSDYHKMYAPFIDNSYFLFMDNLRFKNVMFDKLHAFIRSTIEVNVTDSNQPITAVLNILGISTTQFKTENSIPGALKGTLARPFVYNLMCAILLSEDSMLRYTIPMDFGFDMVTLLDCLLIKSIIPAYLFEELSRTRIDNYIFYHMMQYMSGLSLIHI